MVRKIVGDQKNREASNEEEDTWIILHLITTLMIVSPTKGLDGPGDKKEEKMAREVVVAVTEKDRSMEMPIAYPTGVLESQCFYLEEENGRNLT